MSLLHTQAPDFTLLDQDGAPHALHDYKGQWVLIYFYPKDDTPGCTKQACLIRDGFPSFKKLHAVVLGISTDSVKSHRKFADKYELPFTMLADEEKKVVNMYGVWQTKKMMGRTYMGTVRTSFLINPEGIVAKVYESVKPDLHADMVLADLRELQGA